MKLKTIQQTTTQTDHAATGRHARKLRESAGLSLRDVAASMKRTPSYISDLERGRRNWNARLLADYENALQLK